MLLIPQLQGYTKIRHLCILDCASTWYLNKGRPTWWHLLYYVNLLLNMFRMLIHPSSGACDYLVHYCVGCNAPSSRKLLKMDVLTSETCWAVNWHNKASVIKLVYLYSNKNVSYVCMPKLYQHSPTTWPGNYQVIQTLLPQATCKKI